MSAVLTTTRSAFTAFLAQASENMAENLRGGCFCKAVSYEIDPLILACVNCHCESYRRQCSAPMTTYIGVMDTQWRWTGETPKIFRSSPGVERTFCANCGSPVSFRSQTLSDVMHFYVATMEHPDTFQPSIHVAYEEKLPWLKIRDDLQKYSGPNYLKNGRPMVD